MKQTKAAAAVLGAGLRGSGRWRGCLAGAADAVAAYSGSRVVSKGSRDSQRDIQLYAG